MSSAPPTLNRRRLLIGALPATLAIGALASATACAPEVPPPDLADLQAQFDRARADGELAGEAATGLPGPARQAQVAALTAVAAERLAHADALAAEITRLTAGDPPVTSTGATPTPSTTAPPAPPATVADVVAALRASAEQAAEAAERLTGYRAGLLGSIAASCTAAYQVALGGDGAP